MKTFAQKESQPQQPKSACLTLPKARNHLPDRQGLNTSTVASSPRFGHDFSRIPIYPPAAAARQTTLAINKPGDEYEQEADRIAEQVMGTPAPQQPQPSRKDGRPQVKHLQSDPGRSAVPPVVHEVLAASGQPLDAATRVFFEPRFGYDFGRVRVHTDARAAESARAVDASSYTVGEHIVFAPGQYAPHTQAGGRLLAHELTHTIQSAATPGVLRRQLDDNKKQDTPHKHGNPDWDIQPTNRPNEFELLFSDFMFEHEVLSAVFKAGKLPQGFKLMGGGGSNVTTRWYVTIPADLSAASASALLDPRFANELLAETQKKEKAARLEAEQRIGREQLPKFMARTYEGNLSIGTVGSFHAEYDPVQGVLTISVPIQFNFKDSDSETTRMEGDPRGSKPVTMVTEKEYKQWNSTDIENWRTKFIKIVQDTWSSEQTHHTIYCHKPGWEILQAKVVVKVDQIGPTISGPVFVATVYRGDAPAGLCGPGQVAMMECVKKGSVTLEYSAVRDDMNTAAHEFGHMLGLGDEYEDPGKPGTLASHSAMVSEEFGYGVPRLDAGRTDRFRESIMSSGGKIMPEHGVVFLAAMRQITGIDEWHLRPRS